MPSVDEQERLLDAEFDEDVPEQSESISDSLARQFGAAPWWVISGAFHSLVLLLVTLIISIAVRTGVKDFPIQSELVVPKPPIREEIVKPEIFKMVPVKSELEPVVNPVVFHEPVEISEIVETDDDSEEHLAKGDELAISDVPLGGISSAAGIGLGGPAGGAFGHRGPGGQRRMAGKHGSSGTVSSVELALKWLADHQEADGHWDTVKYGGKKADVSMAGLALLAFLGAGHTEKHGPYAKNVKLAVQWLKSIQQNDGKYYIDGETHGIGYHHAIAGLAMAEAAGMGRVPGTIKSAQRGVDYSVDIHQFGDGSEKLGWRYKAKSAKPDISVSGWFIMQLKSAKIAGLQVDPAAFDGAIKFLDKVEAKGAGGGNGDDSFGGSGHRYGYTNSKTVGVRRTAIGCLGRQFLGWKREELQGGVDWFVNKGGVPSWGANGGGVDLYYWYYGTLCVFQQDGDVWKRWNTGMKKALVDNQRMAGDEKGSWDPVGAYSQYWGRVGQTALACLCLEVYYRYLPMYK